MTLGEFVFFWIAGTVLWLVGAVLFALAMGRWFRWIREQDEVVR